MSTPPPPPPFFTTINIVSLLCPKSNPILLLPHHPTHTHINIANSTSGAAPLHVAAKQNHSEAVAAMLAAGADPAARTNAGETPLDLATAPKVKHSRLVFRPAGLALARPGLVPLP